MAVRVRKARSGSLCGTCGGPILVGQRIGLVLELASWSHVSCILAARDLAENGQQSR